jgi:hypothetical protein
MNFRKFVGAGAIAGALSFSAIGLAGAASAAPAPAPAPSVQHAQLVHWGGPGWHGRGWGRGPGWGGPGFRPGFPGPIGWGGPPPPCLIGVCI